MGEQKMREEKTPILGREVGKPLRPEEYPSREEITSLTGEVGKSRIKEAIGLALISSGLVGLTVGCARELIEPTPTVEPTEVPTEVPTPTSRAEVLPTPTVANIEVTPREIGGVTGEEMSGKFEGETQKSLKYTLQNGEAFFRLGLYPDLPNIAESPDLVNEVVYYQDQPFIFLTTISPLAGYPEALPFYDKSVPKVGIIRWIEGGESVSQQAAFEQLQEGEVSVRLDSEKGIYEFLDDAGNVMRTKEIFEVPELTPTPEPTATPTPEIQRVVYLEDNFAGTNRAVFEGPNPRFEGDTLFFTYPENGGWLWARTRIPMSNFRLEASLAGDGDYGLNFGGSRSEDINYDLILFRDGHLDLNLFQGEDFLGALLSEKVLQRSEVQGFHDFGLEYDGSKLNIFFNGEKVGEVSKARLRGGLEQAGGNGRIGLNCWDDGEKDVEVGIDHLLIKLPQELIPPPTPVPPEPTETPRPPECLPVIPLNERTDPARDPVANRENGWIIIEGQSISIAGEHNFGVLRRIRPDHLLYPEPLRGAWNSTGKVVEVDYREGKIRIFVGGGRYVQGILMENARAYIVWGFAEYRQGNICDVKVGDNVNFYASTKDELEALLIDSNRIGNFIGVEGVR